MRVATVDRTKEWTVEDYILLGEMNTPCQLINGELIMSPSPSSVHQRVLRDLFRILDKNTSKKAEIFFAPIDLYINKKMFFSPT